MHLLNLSRIAEVLRPWGRCRGLLLSYIPVHALEMG
jgi:hypothetical protein